MYWPWLCVLCLIYYCCCPVLAQDTTTTASHSPSSSSPSAVTIYSTTSLNSAAVQSQGERTTSSGSFSSNTASRRPLSSTRSGAHTAPITVSRAPVPATPYHPAPAPPSPPTHRPPLPHPRPVRDHPPTTGAIIGAVLGGLAGVAVLLSLARCIYTYHRQPKRDRIAEVVERHRIQREMEELAHEEFSRPSERPPSPPPLPLYQDTRLPAYEPAARPADTNV